MQYKYILQIYICNISVKMEIYIKRGKSREISSNNAKKVKIAIKSTHTNIVSTIWLAFVILQI